MYAISGVSGHTGSVVADELLRRGEAVRVIVRTEEKGRPWSERGASVAVASVQDAGSLERALSGSAGAYLLSPPDMSATDFGAAARRLAETYGRAVRGSGIAHVVFLSSIGAHVESGTGPIATLRPIEQALRSTGVDVTLLRPAYFIENWASSLGSASENGVLPSFIPAGFRMPMIATRDIGKAAAEALLHPSRGVRILELSGPEDYTPEDIAAAISPLVGKKVQVAEAPLDAVVPTFTSFGISEHIASLYREMLEAVIDGRVAWDGTGERRRGTTTASEVFANMMRQQPS